MTFSNVVRNHIPALPKRRSLDAMDSDESFVRLIEGLFLWGFLVTEGGGGRPPPTPTPPPPFSELLIKDSGTGVQRDIGSISMHLTTISFHLFCM